MPQRYHCYTNVLHLQIDESALLVRMTPELRAAGELFMRNIYTILASNQLEGFYEIEVRKLRDLDVGDHSFSFDLPSFIG